MSEYILSIDQGTTSTRAIVFNCQGQVLAQHQIEFKQYFPNDGWVEHDADDIWQTTLISSQKAIEKAKLAARQIAAVGISNQRETTLVWHKKTGKVLDRAIVWQDRRTTAMCERLAQQPGCLAMIQEKTGLLLDPYFSATKLQWLLDHTEGARAQVERGELAFGTVDSFLLWRLTGGKSHMTDVTNASRTLLYNIHTQCWDEELLALFNIPANILPEVADNSGHFGYINREHLGAEIPVTGMAGDQQAAAFGQACFSEGMIKSTYGTGCFMLMNTGKTALMSKNRLLTTIAYRLHGQVNYALEGSIFVAGAAVHWLRDAVKMIEKASDTESIAGSLECSHGVYLVPAFTGLGAPYWDPQARGALLGMTRDTGVNHIVRAALEAVCYQTKDLLLAMQNDGARFQATLRVDGGMAHNRWLLQFLADILNVTVERPGCVETSALGVAYLAGLGVGIYQSTDEIAKLWRKELQFSPVMGEEKRRFLYQGWLDAVERIRS
ncbi:Glycerol kinase [Piscirickettsia salmonis]|uniref:glycerol kinase GlpK n=1 Tax=Piscirickettsia salmonis TaxID=1238 RepID=UPI0012B78CD2|nr:glycerol kinase GlpK [Piscirickettsia salmonis]QGP49945.1 Glycerol kinase [Piscirickettsia salmonis]QGP54981.1 Glycerol kinase [Piscirickettsia salmonis]QGP59144.1 Glycerol kinase [Piscirickettsia salmonis]QGP64549.1 Glycerol kinase [Piscirickettsia salmonis]